MRLFRGSKIWQVLRHRVGQDWVSGPWHSVVAQVQNGYTVQMGILVDASGGGIYAGYFEYRSGLSGYCLLVLDKTTSCQKASGFSSPHII